MRNICKLIIVISILLILSGCQKTNHNAENLEMYILRHSVIDKNNSEIIKDDSPIFTGNDIKSYDWDTHTIIFTDEFLTERKVDDAEVSDSLIDGGSQILGVFYPDQFAFCLDGEEMYRGYMKPQLFISFLPSGPIISDVENGIEIKNVGNVNDKTDPRDNKELYNFLKDKELLKSD